MKKDENTPHALGPFKPVSQEQIQAQKNVVLPSQKKDYLEAFIHHYCARTAKSKQKTAEYRARYADQRAVSFFHLSLKELCYPLWNASANGAMTVDIDGNEYVDIAGDFGIGIFGHRPEFVRKALEAQLSNGWSIGMRPEKAAVAAEKLCKITGMERAVFSQSGTESVMSAVRLARHVSQKEKVVIFSTSYHGQSDGLLAFRAKIGQKEIAKPITKGTTPGTVKDLVILEYCAEESLAIIKEMAGELAAVVVEPVQSRNIRLHPADFLKKLRALTKEAGIALIFDEMITGFRLAPGGAQEYFQVKPDLATYGKILGGGICLGAIAGKAKYLNAIDGGGWNYGDLSYPMEERTFFAGTHCQNSLAIAAADAVLTKLLEKGPEFQEGLNYACEHMCEEINRIFTINHVPLKTYHYGSLFRFEPIKKLSPIDQNLFTYHLRDQGVMVSEVGNNFLSAAHGSDQINFILQAVEQAILNLKSGGYLNERE